MEIFFELIFLIKERLRPLILMNPQPTTPTPQPTPTSIPLTSKGQKNQLQ